MIIFIVILLLISTYIFTSTMIENSKVKQKVSKRKKSTKE